jgi:aminoglycoside phosphotransferase (APT) family kinase protein
MAAFDLNQNLLRCEEYLSRSLGGQARLLNACRLVKSTRDAPLRLDIELDGDPRTYVLRLDSRGIEKEYNILRAMQAVPILTPRVYGWDPDGISLGVACYISDFIHGEPLLGAVLAGEGWAVEIFLETVSLLQDVSRDQLGEASEMLDEGETAEDVLEYAHAFLQEQQHPLAEIAYLKLRHEMPALPGVSFSNGDLWLENIIVHDRQLAGVIDFENAGFSDPIYELLLSFFVRPELRGRGIEQRYCQRMGFEPGMLPWYHGLEYYDMLH